MLIGIDNKSYSGTYTDEKMFPILSMCGFEAIQYAVSPSAHFSKPNWASDLKKVRNLADNSGIRIHMIHPPIYHIIEKYDKDPLQTEVLEKSFEAAAILGAEWVVIHPQFPESGITEDATNYMDVVLRNREHLKNLCMRASKYNVGIAFENIKRYTDDENCRIPRYGWKPEHIIDAVDNCLSDNVCICVDVGHSMTAGVDPAAAIKAFGSRIKCVHIHDTDGASDQHRIPYMAHIKWAEAITALKDTGFSDVFLLEIGESIRRMPTLDLLTQALKLSNQIARHMISEYF